MSISSNEEFIYSYNEKPSAELGDEERRNTAETDRSSYTDEINENLTDFGMQIGNEMKTSKSLPDEIQKDCCKFLFTIPTRKISDRDVLIATLQSRLKSMENLYKNALNEQQDIWKRYAEIVQKISNPDVVRKIELIEDVNKQPEVLSDLNDLRMEIVKWLEVTKVKPRKCCRHLYEALGIEFPEKKSKNRVVKLEKKSFEEDYVKKLDEIAEQRQTANEKQGSQKTIEENTNIKKGRLVTNYFSGTKEYDTVCNDLITEKAKTEGESKEANQISECQKTCEEIRTNESECFKAQITEYKTIIKKLINECDVQKKLYAQFAEVEEQEKCIHYLQDKLITLGQILECFQFSKTCANKLQSETVQASSNINNNLKDSEKLRKKKSKPSSIPKNTITNMENIEPCNFKECFNIAEQKNSTANDLKAKLRSSTKETFSSDFVSVVKLTVTSYDKELASKKPLYTDKCNSDKIDTYNSILQTLSSKTLWPKEGQMEQAKSVAADEKHFKNSTESDKKKKEKLPCCARSLPRNKKYKYHENLDNKTLEKPCCHNENYSEKSKELAGGNQWTMPQTRKNNAKRRGSLSSYCQRHSPKEKRSKSEDPARQKLNFRKKELEVQKCCDFDDCSLNKESKEVMCCDLEAKVLKHDACISTVLSCHELCPNYVILHPFTNLRKSKEGCLEGSKEKDLEDALRTNRDLEGQIKSQIMVISRKEETIEDLQNQLRETVTKSKKLFCKFSFQLDELKTGYENLRKEVCLLKENKEVLTRNLLACLDNKVESKNKLRVGYQLALQEKNEVEKLLMQSETEFEFDEETQSHNFLDVRSETKNYASRSKELKNNNEAFRNEYKSKYNEVMRDYNDLKEKLLVSETERVLLKKDIDDLKETLYGITKENKELQLLKLEYNELTNELDKKAQKMELEVVRQEKEQQNKRITDLESEVVTIDIYGLAVEEINAQLSEALVKMKRDLEFLKDSKNNLENQLLKKQKEISQLQNDLEKISRDVDSANNARALAEKLYKEQLSDLDEQKCLYQDTSNELQLAKDINNCLSQDLDKLQAEHIHLKENVLIWKSMYEDDLENTQKQLANRTEELQHANEKLVENKELLKSTVCEYECKLNEVSNKYDTLQQELLNHQKNEKMLENKLAEYLNELENFKLETLERTKEYQQEKKDNERLRRELDQSCDDFRQKQKSLEDVSLVLEQTRRDKTNMESDLKKTIYNYENTINELIKAQELTTSELLILKEKMSQLTQENYKLKESLIEKYEMQDTISFFMKELEDLRMAKVDINRKNESMIFSYISKIEKLTIDYQDAQTIIQRLMNTLSEMNAEMKNIQIPLECSTDLTENNIRNEEFTFKNKIENELELRMNNETKTGARCNPDCKRRCAERKQTMAEIHKREECRKCCDTLKKSGKSRDKLKKDLDKRERENIEKFDGRSSPISKECSYLCVELNSIKKILSDFENVSITNSKAEMKSGDRESGSHPKDKKGRSYEQKNDKRKAKPWKEKYEKTALERDALKEEISEFYKKFKEVMKELENKLKVRM